MPTYGLAKNGGRKRESAHVATSIASSARPRRPAVRSSQASEAATRRSRLRRRLVVRRRRRIGRFVRIRRLRDVVSSARGLRQESRQHHRRFLLQTANAHPSSSSTCHHVYFLALEVLSNCRCEVALIN